MGRTGLALVIACIATGSAVADPVEDARKAFERGRTALQTGNYEQACAAFGESYELDPLPETRFNIALCSEETGKLATALHHYQELAKSESSARRVKAAQAAESLAKRVPRLRIELGNKDKVVPAGFVVTLDGVRVTNFKDTPIDIGAHTVMAAASGHENWQGVAEASWEREIVIVSITLVPGQPGPDILTLKPQPPPRKKPTSDPLVTPDPSDPTRATSSLRRPIGIGLTIGGGAALAGALVAGLFAQSRYSDAKQACGGTQCGEPDSFARGQKLVDEARSLGNLSTALTIGGGVLATAGLVLWLTAPSGEQQIAITPTTNGASVSGRW
ncbi:MAG: tetratricopeptide repeat protein [Kofleriaceae bacterium]